MGRSLRIGKLFGIPIRLHFSWPIVFVYLTVMLALPSGLFPTFSLQMRVIGSIITSLLFFGAVVLHELAHSLVATRMGIPVKSITLFIFGGVAQITREVVRPRDELLIALAGPLCSLVLAGFLGLVWFVLPASLYPYLSIAIFWLAIMNLILALFNLIPGFPLDGGRVLRALFWQGTGNYRKSTYIASWVGRSIGYLFILVGVTAMFTSQLEWAPFFAQFLGLYGGLWLAFIGWLLETAAGNSYQQAEMHHALQVVTAADAMIAPYPCCPSPTLSLREFIQSYAQLAPHHRLPVLEEGKLKGMISLSNIVSVPQQDWETTQIADVMTILDERALVRPGDNALRVLDQMEKHDLSQLLVAEEGSVLGMITRDNLLRLVRTQIQEVK